MITKACKRCQVVQPLENFYRNGKYVKHICKDCGKPRTQQLYYENHAERLDYRTRRRKRPESQEYHRNYKLKSKFGLSSIEYDEMLDIQEKLCYICKEPSSKTLHVDHCHATNKVRKLLCFRCNTVLGHVKENEELLRNMIVYIREHNA